jgi:TatD DNase family protein
MLIDTHCHLNFDDFKNDREEIIGRCSSNNIWLINVGADYETSRKAVEIAEKYDKGVYATVAVHPHNVDKEKFDFDKFYKLARNKKVAAIGECGLDYAFCENDEKIQKLQQEVFVQHLELAQKINKPVIIHCRRLFPEILKIIQDTKYYIQNTGVLHCYMGRWSYAQEYLKLGFYIGFTGLITYARDYDKVIKNTPIERILVETDAPYLPPHLIPLGGGGLTSEDRRKIRNTPDNVKYVAEKIAEIKEIPFEKVASQTTQNAKKLFNL